MDRKRLVSGILFFFILFLSVGSVSPPDDTEQLIDAFRRAGGQPEKIVLHHGNRTQTPLLREEVDDLARRLSRELGLGPARRTEDRHGHRWTATGKWGRNLQARLNVINDRVDLRKNRPYISVQLTGRGHPDGEWPRFRERLEKVLTGNGIDPHLQFSIQGSRPGMGSDPEETVRRVLQRLNAREIEGMRTDRTTSISAFTPALRGGLETKGGMMNVQVAARMDRSGERLILTLGTPIITIEY
ncbi:TATA-box binding protein [Planifilum fimeticola]|jgi:hypothetical protein|uniref:TATA-box binding protein n=1 Tax=Planifilum fimeticola TaxID=201975 RepID=A0A2T0LHW2_9BACL|nr:YwmB family TATA-box binding protein [Planifilum fimeticola]PRX42004.1 TATA-box binding protein [Planifilum fimeticola]